MMGSYGRLIGGKEVIEKVHNPNSPWRNIKPVPLRDCPKCGAKQSDRLVATAYFGFKIGADGWKVYCRNCWNQTVFCPTMEDAVKLWNEGDST